MVSSGGGSMGSPLEVDRRPFRRRCIWPIVVCSDFFRYLRTRMAVRPGNDRRKFLVTALMRVFVVG